VIRRAAFSEVVDESSASSASSNLLRELTSLLVRRQYSELERRSKRVRMSADELKTAVEDYGRRLVALPEEARKLTDTPVVNGSQPARFSVRQPLWTEEGRSDLTFEVTLIESAPGSFEVEVDDLHVL